MYLRLIFKSIFLPEIGQSVEREALSWTETRSKHSDKTQIIVYEITEAVILPLFNISQL